MSNVTALSERVPTPLLIVFGDLTYFARVSRRTDDPVIADVIDQHYAIVGRHVGGAGGHVVKHMGDGFLAVFASEDVDAGVRCLLALRAEVDEAMAGRGWDCRLVLKAHFGTAIAGPFGPERRFDVIGKAVNTAALVESRGVALTADTFRKLSPDTRKLFKKHTPPITYIGADDRRPC